MKAIFIFFITFFIYLFTIYPTIPFHDAGDMITAVYLLGIPHPTGYPLFTIFGKLFITIIPFGNIAFRMNILSALFASLSCMMIYLITLKLTSRIIPSIVSSLILAFFSTFWQQAIIAEKYTLNALFFTLIIFIFIKWKEEKKTFLLYLAFFLLGLSFTHHMQTLFVLPGIIFLILKNSIKRDKKRIKLNLSFNPLWVFALFIIPLFLYSYLPIRAKDHPFINWGDPDRINGFIDYITAKGYAHYFEKSGILDYFKRAFLHLKNHIIKEFSFLFFPSIIGLFLFFKKKDIFIFFSLIILTNIAHCSHYNIPNVWDYYIPTYIILSICFGFFLSSFLSLHRILSFLAIFLVILPLYLFSKNITFRNKALDYSYYDEGMGYLKPLKKDAIFLTKGDICFVIWYLHYVENVRPDIFLINGTFLHTFWLMEEISKIKKDLLFDKTLPTHRVSSIELANIRFEKYREIMEKNSSKYCIYTPFVDDITKGFRLLPEGFVNRVIKEEVKDKEYIEMLKKANFNIFPYQKRSKRLVNNVKNGYIRQGVLFAEKGMYIDSIASFKNVLKIDPKDKESRVNIGKSYYNLGLDFDQKGMLNKAEEYYKEAIKIDPNMIDAYFNLGLSYYKRNNFKMSIYWWNELVKKDPKHIKTLENLATVYFNTGNIKEAKNLCRKILSYNQNNELANRMLLVIGR